ncbi:MAG: hypothetical protein ACYCPV_06790, partial [Thermoplasmata archaeon]
GHDLIGIQCAHRVCPHCSTSQVIEAVQTGVIPRTSGAVSVTAVAVAAGAWRPAKPPSGPATATAMFRTGGALTG